MRAAHIENGLVVNLLEVPNLVCFENVTLVEAPAECGIGWSYSAGVFIAPPVDLAQAKAAKLLEIERDRDAACVMSVVALGRTWQADDRSQKLLGNEINLAMAGLSLTPVWRDADNNDMPVTGLADLLAIAAAMKAQTRAAYFSSWARKQALEAATTAEQVEAV